MHAEKGISSPSQTSSIPTQPELNPAGSNPTQVNMNPEVTHIDFDHLKARFLFYWHRVLSILLVGHGLLETWEGITFLFAEYPELSHKLDVGELTQSELIFFVIQVCFAAIETGISFFLAHRVHNLSEEADLTIDLVLSTLFLLITPLLAGWIGSIHFATLFETML
jgi:hypothetical protein